ncbi:MAG: DUF4174 domain-containing protein [Cytophagales bacterium]|nr:DUF4174 domain-containing protein [Cytophagales bacterium]
MVAQFFLLISLIFINQQSPFTDYRWEQRIIVIDVQMEHATQQLTALLEQEEALKERDLLVFLKKGNELICKNANKPTEVDIRDRYSGVVLIGKDGGIKLKRDRVVATQIIFDLIDSMPMRQSEMRRKSNP